MKVKFWLNGSGGSRHEEAIVTLPDDYSEEDIEYELNDWKYSMRCNSQVIRYGWDEVED